MSYSNDDLYVYNTWYDTDIFICCICYIRDTMAWPHMFWPQPHKNVWPHTSWPWPHPPLASLTSLAWTYCSAETLLSYCSPFRYIVNKRWKLHTQDSWGSGLDWQLPISCRSETAARHTSCDRTTKRTATISPHIHIRTFLHTYICIYLLKNTAEQHG